MDWHGGARSDGLWSGMTTRGVIVLALARRRGHSGRSNSPVGDPANDFVKPGSRHLSEAGGRPGQPQNAT
jgi:hypothetical protein